jgi:hypothetical protein
MLRPPAIATRGMPEPLRVGTLVIALAITAAACAPSRPLVTTDDASASVVRGGALFPSDDRPAGWAERYDQYGDESDRYDHYEEDPDLYVDHFADPLDAHD